MPALDKSVLYAEFERHVNSFDSAVTSFFSNAQLPGYQPAPEHHHARAELLFCSKGLINCQVEKCLWVIPENAALWVPAGATHRGFGRGYAELYALYVDSETALRLPDEAFLIQTSVLLREMIVKSACFNQAYLQGGAESRFFHVMLDEIAVAQRLDLIVPMPTDPRLRMMVEHLILNPSDKTSNSEWAARLALSERSFSRIVMQQLGMTFCRWRHQMHISIAIPKIRNGEPIQKLAHELGYENASSFISMFKNIMRMPPSRFGVKTRHRQAP